MRFRESAPLHPAPLFGVPPPPPPPVARALPTKKGPSRSRAETAQELPDECLRVFSWPGKTSCGPRPVGKDRKAGSAHIERGHDGECRGPITWFATSELKRPRKIADRKATREGGDGFGSAARPDDDDRPGPRPSKRDRATGSSASFALPKQQTRTVRPGGPSPRKFPGVCGSSWPTGDWSVVRRGRRPDCGPRSPVRTGAAEFATLRRRHRHRSVNPSRG